MKKLTMIGMAALLVLAVSCKKDEKTNAVQGPGFRASLEIQAGNDKTHLEDGTKVKWDAGDAILVINSSNEAKEFATETGVMTDGYADFQSADATESFYTPNYKAYYPSDLYNTTTGKISLPQTQQYAAGSFGRGFNPMAAQATDETLEFKNICGMLALQFTGSCTVDNIRITSKDDEMLWGEGDLTLTGVDDNVTLALNNLSSGGNSITLECDNTVALDPDIPTTFYFVLPDGALTSGFDVVLTDSHGIEWERSASTNTEVHMNKIRKMSELNITPLPAVGTIDECIDCTYTISGMVMIGRTETCEFGFVYAKSSENPDPTLDGTSCTKYCLESSYSVDNEMEFTADLTPYSLEPGVDYAIKAYAIVDGETYYGAVKLYSTPALLPSSWSNGENPHPFTVGVGKVVHFSQGNLQFDLTGSEGSAASGESVGGTWRFADHQFDFIGANGANMSSIVVGVPHEGWMDLFGWGTSGYNHGAEIYQPWSGVGSNNKYFAYGHNMDNLNSQNPAIADWGYNAIINGGNTVNSGWRTLTGGPDSETTYLLEGRSNASNLYGEGMVSCIRGFIILPDDWTGCPTGLTFTSGPSDWVNRYTYAQWSQMEALGAVFLPVAGVRYNDGIRYLGPDTYWGHYWTATSYYDNANNTHGVYALAFSDETVLKANIVNHGNGRPVRLVKDAN